MSPNTSSVDICINLNLLFNFDLLFKTAINNEWVPKILVYIKLSDFFIELST